MAFQTRAHIRSHPFSSKMVTFSTTGPQRVREEIRDLLAIDEKKETSDRVGSGEDLRKDGWFLERSPKRSGSFDYNGSRVAGAG